MKIGTAAIGSEMIAFLALSLALSAAEKTQSDELLGSRVAEMFKVGYAGGPRALQESQKLRDSLRVDSHNSPRIDYAHGLVLLKLLKNKEAKAELQIATKRPGPMFLPAWQALIWSHFVAKEMDHGYARLLDFAQALPNAEGITDAIRREKAYWIGRVMAALEMSLDSNSSRESWTQSEKRLQDCLGPGLVDAYSAGKEDVHAKHLVLADEIRQTLEKEKGHQAELQEKKIEDAGKSIDAAKQKSDDLKRTAADLKEDQQEKIAAFKKQMDRMEREYNMVERREMTLLSQMLVFDQQINLLQNSRNANARNIAALQSRRGLLDTEFQLTAAASQQLTANAQKMAEEQAELAQQYEKATGEIVQEDVNAKKWKERSEKHADELKKAAKKPKGAGPAVAAKIHAATSFRTYVDFDLVAERDKVLESFGVSPDGK